MAEQVSRRSIVYEILTDFSKGKASIKETETALGNIDKKASGLNDVFKAAGEAIVAAFAIEKISAFAQEAFELGLKAEGVRKAFNRLNDPTLLNNLRKATKGTVDDLTLMQATVRADKFKIPLNNLAKYFEFAQIRAKETGQSVDYLVNSIIDGIGRKSPLILDNLGLSAKDIGEKFKKTGDFAGAVGEIITDELGKTAQDTMEDTAEKVEQLRTQFKNFKLEIGSALVDALGETNSAFEGLGETLTKIFPFLNLSTKNTEWTKMLAERAEEAAQATADLAKSTNAFIDSFKPKPLQDGVITVAELQENLKKLQDQLLVTDVSSSLFTELKNQAVELEKRIKELLETSQKAVDEFQGIAVVPEGQKGLTEKFAAEEQKKLDEKKKLEEERRGLVIKTSEIEDTAHADLMASLDEEIEKRKQIEEVRAKAIQDAINTFDVFSQLAADGSNAQLGFSIASVIAANAEALAKGVASAMQLPFPANIAAGFSVIATVTSMFAQIKAIESNAKQAQKAANRSKFAEGTPYLERDGQPRGTDTIPIMANEGERIVPTDENLRHWDIFEAIRQNQLEDYINFNYVSPALATKAIEESSKDSMLDYSTRFYRQLIATNEGNGINKKALRYLSSIDRKLNSGIPKRYV